MDGEEKKPVVVSGFKDIPEPEQFEFKFSQNGKDFVLLYRALTAESVENINATFEEPVPPEKFIEGTARDIQLAAAKGTSVTYRDYQDPAYLAAVGRIEKERNLEMVRASLGWGPIPDGVSPPSQEILQTQEEFRREMRRRMTAGNFANLLRAVTRATFALDQGLVNAFLPASAPLTPEGTDF